MFHPDLGSYVKSEYFVNPDLGRPKDDLFVSPDAVLHMYTLARLGRVEIGLSSLYTVKQSLIFCTVNISIRTGN